MSDYSSAYSETRSRLIDLVRSLDDSTLERTVPACPGWTVKDLFAHVTAISTDALNGRLDGVGSPEWTSRQISERKDKSVTEIAEEWEQSSTALDPMLDQLHPAQAGMFVADLAVHEQDARVAVGEPAIKQGDSLETALYTYVRFFGTRIKNAGLPALEVRAGENTWTAGKGEVGGSLTADPFELFRALSGRRTHEQIRSFDWSVDPEPYMSIFSMYGTPETTLHE